MSTGPLCELFHTFLIFRACSPTYTAERCGSRIKARTDFGAIESDLEVIQKRLARLPTRRELEGTALGIVLATMMLTAPFLIGSEDRGEAAGRAHSSGIPALCRPAV
jgi:hypothetical protein